MLKRGKHKKIKIPPTSSIPITLNPNPQTVKTLNPHYVKIRARSTTHTRKLFPKKRDKSITGIVMFRIRLFYRSIVRLRTRRRLESI